MIVDCAVYTKGERRPGTLALADASEAGRSDPDSFVWIGVHDPTEGEFEAVDMRHYFRDVEDHLEKEVARVEIQRDLLSDALGVNLTHVSVQQNDDMRKISGWVAIAAVPTMLAGIWGMNFEHMPELDEWWGYPMALGLILLLSVAVYRYLRRQGWI